MKNKLSTLALFTFFIFSNSNALNITNSITGLGLPENIVNPYLCLQDSSGKVGKGCDLTYGQTADGNACSGNPNYVGATLRFGGCTAANTYLGYMGINADSLAYQPPQGVHIAYTNAKVTNGVLTGQIQYTPINANANLLSTAPSQNVTWPFVGMNLSGLEFSLMPDPTVIPNLSIEDKSSTNSDLADTQTFFQDGMNTVRIPVSWDYLQMSGAGKGDITNDYFNDYVKPLLETLTIAKVNTIVDLHAYMHYSTFGKQYSGCSGSSKCPDGQLITDPAIYNDIWLKIYQAIKADPNIDMNYIMFDLMNEPAAATDGSEKLPTETVFNIETQLIKTLRNAGFAGYLLVEGNEWSGLHSWVINDGNNTPNAQVFTAANFAQAGISDLSKILINVHQYFDSNYSGTQDQCQTDLSTTGQNAFNLNAFANYLQQNHLKAIVTEFGSGTDSTTCSTALNQFLTYLKDNAAGSKDYGFVGWTIWSTGHGWGGYNLRVKPDSYQMDVLKQYLKG